MERAQCLCRSLTRYRDSSKKGERCCSRRRAFTFLVDARILSQRSDISPMMRTLLAKLSSNWSYNSFNLIMFGCRQSRYNSCCEINFLLMPFNSNQILPEGEYKSSMALGFYSFQKSRKFFLRVSKLSQRRKSSMILQRMLLFIRRLLRKDQRKSFCFFITLGQVQERRPHRQRKGICVDGKTFFRSVLSDQKSFSLLFTSFPMGFVVTVQRTQLGTKGLGLTTSWPFTTTSQSPSSLGLLLKVRHLRVDLKFSSMMRVSLAEGTKTDTGATPGGFRLFEIGSMRISSLGGSPACDDFLWRALALKAEMNQLSLLLSLVRIASGSVTIDCCGFLMDGGCVLGAGLGGLGFMPILSRKSRSIIFRLRLAAGSSLCALKAESQSKFSMGCTG